MSLPKFITEFNSLEVPDPIRTKGLTDQRLQQESERYFTRVLASFQLSTLALEDSFERLEKDQNNAHISELWLKDIQPLAAVTSSVDENATYLARFTKLRLNNKAIQTVDALIEADDVLDRAFRAF